MEHLSVWDQGLDQFPQQYLNGRNILTLLSPLKNKIIYFPSNWENPCRHLSSGAVDMESLWLRNAAWTLFVTCFYHSPWAKHGQKSRISTSTTDRVDISAGRSVPGSGGQFPSGAKRLKNILNPGQNMHVEGTEPHKKQYLAKGNSVGKFMRRWQFLRNADRPELRGTDFVHRWPTGILNVYLRDCKNFCVRSAGPENKTCSWSELAGGVQPPMWEERSPGGGFVSPPLPQF